MKPIDVVRLFIFTSVLIMLPHAIADEKTDALVAQCTMCHGADGNSPSFAAPTIAGITEYYFKYSMDAYKNDGRKSDMMKVFADTLSPEDLDILAKYYAKQKPKAGEQKFDANLASKGKDLHYRYCEKCHANNGGVSIDGYGILAGQWMPFLQLTLEEYEAGKRRTNEMMLIKLKKMRAQEGEKSIEQLLHFYASLKL